MILVDDRAGSKELVRPLRAQGLEVVECRLDFGDVAFQGRGVKGTPVDIGVEFKKVPDLVTSIRDGRLPGYQIPGMLGEHGAYEYAWLLIEGQWDISSQGLVTMRSGTHEWKTLPGRMTASELNRRLITYVTNVGLYVWRTYHRQDTVSFLTSLYRRWTDVDLDQHDSHVVAHQPFAFAALSDFRDVVSRFPGIGVGTSASVEEYFEGSLERAIQAGVDEWAKIPVRTRTGTVRRLGLRTAEQIVAFCKGVGHGRRTV